MQFRFCFTFGKFGYSIPVMYSGSLDPIPCSVSAHVGFENYSPSHQKTKIKLRCFQILLYSCFKNDTDYYTFPSSVCTNVKSVENNKPTEKLIDIRWVTQRYIRVYSSKLYCSYMKFCGSSDQDVKT